MAGAKPAIPIAARREAVARLGAIPGETVNIQCAYCDTTGTVKWRLNSRGTPHYWPMILGLELDHVHPVHLGGPNTANNLTLACRPCNRGKGRKTVTEWMKAGAPDGR